MTAPDETPFSTICLAAATAGGVVLAVVIAMTSDGALTLPLAVLCGCTIAWAAPLGARAGLRHLRR